MQFDAILFDKDGTLFDFAATWEAWAESFLLRITKHDRAHAERLGAVIGFDLNNRSFSKDSVVIAGTPGEVAEALRGQDAALGLRPGELMDILNQEAAQAPQKEAVPLVPYLRGLRGHGLRLGVATNDAEMPARAHLNAAGVTELFDFIAGFDSGHGAKPEPGQLLAFAEAMKLPPERVIMVGDSTHDLEAGRRAGMHRVGVLTGMADEAELAPFADVILPDIGRIPAHFALI